MSQLRERTRLRLFWTWHRRFGIAAALLVLVLGLTGLALNHTAALRLDQRFATAGWLLDWYGIEAPETSASHMAGQVRVTLLGDRLYLDGQAVPGHFARLAGAVAAGGFVAVATQGEIVILMPDGRLVDRLGVESGVPQWIDAIGTATDGSVILRSGDELYAAPVATLEWAMTGPGPGIRWSAPGELPVAELHALQADFRSRILPVERVVLDLHSGRIAGTFGVLLMDGAAILLLLLALTGSWMWLARRR
jgi:uncharacterized iron-regulated membrane protein